MAFPQLTKFRMEAYIQNLFQEKPDVALRIMIVREHLAQEVADFLPEMFALGFNKPIWNTAASI